MDNTQQIVDLLKALKATYPNLRMGQILVNAVGQHPRRCNDGMSMSQEQHLNRIFYIQDEELIEALKNYF